MNVIFGENTPFNFEVWIIVGHEIIDCFFIFDSPKMNKRDTS